MEIVGAGKEVSCRDALGREHGGMGSAAHRNQLLLDPKVVHASGCREAARSSCQAGGDVSIGVGDLVADVAGARIEPNTLATSASHRFRPVETIGVEVADQTDACCVVVIGDEVLEPAHAS